MKNDLALHRLLIGREAPSEWWIRPTDWLPMPDIPDGEQKIIILFALDRGIGTITDMFTVYGNYTVDWGDGSAPDNFASASSASHQFNYDAIAESSLNSTFHKQVLITITPQPGNNLTKLSFSSSNAVLKRYYDVAIRAPFISEIANLFRVYGLERFRMLGATDSLSSDFFTFTGSPFISVFEINTNNFTSLNTIFDSCRALRFIDINLSGKILTNIQRMAYYCSAKYINLHGAVIVGTADSAFAYAQCLSEISGIDFSGATSLANIFTSCKALSRLVVTGISLSVSLSGCLFSRDALIEVFSNLESVIGQTITITNCPGAALLTATERAIATDKGWTISG